MRRTWNSTFSRRTLWALQN